MKFTETKIKGLYIIKPKLWEDERGYFYESYNKKSFEEAGINADFVQDNQSLSHEGALRGLHAQAEPNAQGKLVRVIRGSINDIAVDIRKNSPTYGEHVAIELNEDNHLQLWIPPGFLHGFLTLKDDTIFTYKVTSLYDKSSEIGAAWNDPDLNIAWGVNPGQVILSEKDKHLPSFKDLLSPF